LQSISGVLNSSSSLPILDNFLFEIIEGKLTVSASDLETTMRTTMDLTEADADGKVAIPAKLLMDVLKNLPDQPCTFLIDNDNFGVEISYENGKSKMSGFRGDEFPKTPTVDNSKSVKVNGDVIVNGIGKSLFATGNDDLRPVMTGVLCQFSPSSILFVATDAHKLVRYMRTDATADGESSFILPKKPLNLLRTNISPESEVLIEYNESNAVFSFGDIVLVCRLIDGTYPNWEAVIPTDTPNVLIVDRLQLLSAIKRVSIFANKTTHQVRLGMSGTELRLSAEDRDYNNEASERLNCKYDGEDREVGFNSKFLVEMLTIITTKEIYLEMGLASKPGLIKPSEQTNEHEDILMMIMPVTTPERY